jgi:glyoxylase-like metal-dependent hydrolase (beta-lactamase superfamily II)
MVTQAHTMLSRRAFCLCCLAASAVTATALTPRRAYAEARNIVNMIREAAAEASIDVRKLRGGISVLEGSGGNIAVLAGQDGKLLVDAGITASRTRILAALAGIGSQPITHLINTHWHFDHADGNEWLHAEGASILAHANTRKHLQAAQRVEDWNFDFPAAPSGALPGQSISADTTLKLNGSTLLLKPHSAAHTDGDISVTFAEADVLHTGDTYWNGIYPFIDYSTGGSITGMIRAADASLAMTTDNTIIIPGHGAPVSNKAELRAYRDMLVAIHDNVAALKRQGRSLDETIAAKPTAAFDAKWGQFVITPAFFTKLVYEGV